MCVVEGDRSMTLAFELLLCFVDEFLVDDEAGSRASLVDKRIHDTVDGDNPNPFIRVRLVSSLVESNGGIRHQRCDSVAKSLVVHLANEFADGEGVRGCGAFDVIDKSV